MTTIIRREPEPVDETAFPGLHPLLARIYTARDIVDGNELDYQLSRLLSYHALKGIDEAVDLLVEVLKQKQKILVVGDFDADGATSSALMMRALRMMGCQSVDYLVPNRFEYGYGLSPEIVAVAAGKQPDLIITVDNGIASIDGVAAAKARGIRVIITDHHLPAEDLPEADAIVNPNQRGDTFPSKHLAGVGVAFYLMIALRARLREMDWFTQTGLADPNLATLLDLVALGTVADVVPLDHNNRILVSQGMARIRAGQCCAGITALLKAGNRNPQRLVAADLGFAVGPRLNAAGRLDDMSHGIECLLEDDADRAMVLARSLDELNKQRRSVEADMQEDALQLIHELHLESESLPYGICLFDEHWHEGVIGILASRIKEKTCRPVIGFAPSAAENGQLKGSARSIPGLHIRDVLDEIASQHPGLILRFGGHAAAAGLSLEQEKLAAFSQAFDKQVRQHLDESQLQNQILSDGMLSAEEMRLSVAELLRTAGPWGQAFPEPIFDGEFELVERRIVGERHLKLQVREPASGTVLDAIAFNTTDHDWHENVVSLHLAYRLDVNEFRGRRSVQLMAESVQPL